MPTPNFPSSRLLALNQKPVKPDGSYVLYWMVSNRRMVYNYSLDRAIAYAVSLNKPLLVVEPLAKGYRWSSPRFHQFIMQGMKSNMIAAKDSALKYYPFVETDDYPQEGMLRTFASSACVVITDDFPCFFIPQFVRKLSHLAPCLSEAVDSNGILPIRATDRLFTVAHSFRRHCQKVLPDFLSESPLSSPTSNLSLPRLEPLGDDVISRWPSAEPLLSQSVAEWMTNITTHLDTPSTDLAGGRCAALEHWQQFKQTRLDNYHLNRSHIDVDATSCLSPYLHFGHISSHELVRDLQDRGNIRPEHLRCSIVDGRRERWWQMPPGPEAFLDQLITWRELGYNRCANDPAYDKFETLPEWALATLNIHRNDERPYIYSMEEFDLSLTHDPLWNAAQNQLRTQGTIHNYLRMLWGKKILHWSESPETALDMMIELNNRYALDGRNPNSYSGIFWCLGRFDRAWGPERAIFGKVRYMTSQSTARKYNVSTYLDQFAPEQGNIDV